MAGTVLWEKGPLARPGARHGTACRIARRQLCLERFEDCRGIAENLPEVHAAGGVVAGYRKSIQERHAALRTRRRPWTWSSTECAWRCRARYSLPRARDPSVQRDAADATSASSDWRDREIRARQARFPDA